MLCSKTVSKIWNSAKISIVKKVDFFTVKDSTNLTSILVFCVV